MFASKVYKILQKVPRGKVTTYKVIAAAIGNPKAARAVGGALNKNPYAPKVPCHRVVKSNSKVGGYKLGTKRKIELLEKEGVEICAGKVRKRFILEKL